MTTTATAVIREAALRAFLAGERQRAFDLAKLDPGFRYRHSFGEFCIGAAHELVSRDAREYAEAVIKRDLDQLNRAWQSESGAWRTYEESRTRGRHRQALDLLETMSDRDVLNLRYRLAKAVPHLLCGPETADIVLKLMGRA